MATSHHLGNMQGIGRWRIRRGNFVGKGELNVGLVRVKEWKLAKFNLIIVLRFCVFGTVRGN